MSHDFTVQQRFQVISPCIELFPSVKSGEEACALLKAWYNDLVQLGSAWQGVQDMQPHVHEQHIYTFTCSQARFKKVLSPLNVVKALGFLCTCASAFEAKAVDLEASAEAGGLSAEADLHAADPVQCAAVWELQWPLKLEHFPDKIELARSVLYRTWRIVCLECTKSCLEELSAFVGSPKTVITWTVLDRVWVQLFDSIQFHMLPALMSIALLHSDLSAPAR